MGSIIRAQKIAAKKIGISFQEYIQKIKLEKWCTKCKEWHVKSSFSIDNSRGDKLSAACIKSRRVKNPYSSLKGRISTFKGKRHTQESKDKISKK